MKQIKALLDVNDDGDLTLEDIETVVRRHEWMLCAGAFILLGSLYNLYTNGLFIDDSINSDAFWAGAGIAAVWEYLDDIRSDKK